MASLELLILLVAVSAIVSYGLTKINATIGAIFTIFVTTFVFGSLAFYGFDLSMDTTVNILPHIVFSQSYIGFYFTIIIVFIYLMVSFFHPNFLKMVPYKGAYSFLFLLSLAGILGAFYTAHFLQLFFFFELTIWSTFFLIPQGKKRDAAIPYFAFGVAGSVLMLIGIFIIYNQTGHFEILSGLAALSGSSATWVFVLFVISGFAKLGAFPLHTWLPVAHGNAPHSFSPVLSGALVKLGAFVAILGLVAIGVSTPMIDAIGLPIGHLIVAFLGALSIVFGTLMAIKEDDAKKLLAYSSMSHGGYILVAFSLLNDSGFAGGFYHILAHALASASGFLAIAAVARVTKTTKMKELGGMIHNMPITYLAYLIAIISMAGIPPMGGFISKWLIFQGVIDRGLIIVGVAVFFGSVGSFLYVFRPLAALFLGQQLSEYKHIKEAPLFMLIPTFILMLANIYTGVLPYGILNYINQIIVDFGGSAIDVSNSVITVKHGAIDPMLISGIFGVGVFVSFIIFIVLKKSKKVGLMDTYTAANFVHDEHLLHYTTDFYAPLERLYERYTTWMTRFYTALAEKVKELGSLSRYLFMSSVKQPILWILVGLVVILWGDLL
jgi:NADH-quinone oxidoreductase subunit M